MYSSKYCWAWRLMSLSLISRMVLFHFKITSASVICEAPVIHLAMSSSVAPVATMSFSSSGVMPVNENHWLAKEQGQ